MATTIINDYKFDRQNIKAGILHFGVGNFHRAHLEFYTSQLLANPSQSDWGICGAMILQNDEPLYRALKSQQGEYTLTVCGRNGHNDVYRLGALVELYWGVEEQSKILNKIADKDIHIITLTITEGGYNLSRKTGEFLLDTKEIAQDLENPQNPKTVFGYIAEGLRLRRANGAGPITILSCDNLQHNGDTACRAFTSFIQAQDEELAEWVKKNVSFPNSMVDRITPATRKEDIERLNKTNGTQDKAPVYCEDFIQWVIEDLFVAGRPQWEEVGAQLTNDVSAFENMKLSLLNASHTLLSYPAFLSGYRKVDQAMLDSRILKFVRQFMDIDITPYVPSPAQIDLEEYKTTLCERFSNQAVSDQIARLCFDGASKFPVYIMPNLGKMIADNKDLTRLAYLFATYRHYLKYKKDDLGEDFSVADPWLTDHDYELIGSENPMDFLALSPFRSLDLANATSFTEPYLSMVHAVKENGAMSTLENIL